MAKTEPKTSSRTMPARMIPSPVPPKDSRSAASATWPATATCRLGPTAVWAVATKCLAWVVEMFWASTSKVTVAKPVLPSALTWLAPSRVERAGDGGDVGEGLDLGQHGVDRRPAPTGSVTWLPSVVWKTICSRSPATAGAAAWSRSSAWVDSVLGREKLLEYAVPTDCGQPAGQDQGGEPAQQHDDAVADAPGGKALHCGDSSIVGSGDGVGSGRPGGGDRRSSVDGTVRPVSAPTFSPIRRTASAGRSPSGAVGHDVGVEHPDRLVPLDGAFNFRDLGGYPGAEGGVTRWGTLFRSDTLHELTPADVDHPAGHGTGHRRRPAHPA